jgi:hypothetical protein
MVIKLYIDYGSQPSRAVLAFCLLNKIPAEIIEISVFSGAVTLFQFSNANSPS